MLISDGDRTEIERARQESNRTRRPTVPALEEILFEPIPVLDHGFIRVVDYMGDDASVVQAARVSYGRGTRKTSEDRALTPACGAWKPRRARRPASSRSYHFRDAGQLRSRIPASVPIPKVLANQPNSRIYAHHFPDVT
jgi:hypothetical protein